MQLEHSFTVPVGIDDAWRILLDIERIGPCMPGAVIDSVHGDDFTGQVKVKLGPINLTYKGKASFVEKDEAAHRAVIDARGRDARGNGTASAKVTATLRESGSATAVKVQTDLDITGKPAQFGRGVMVDVGNKLIGQFADCLARTITEGDAASGADTPADVPAEPAPAASRKRAARPKPQPGVAPIEQSAPQPVDEAPPVETPAAEVAFSDEPAPELEEEPVVTAPVDDATPSFATPGGIPVPELGEEPSVNGHSAGPQHRAQPEVEPINLLESAGPAVAKRLAPVAVALVFVLIGIRRRRGKRA